MDLFAQQEEANRQAVMPLAARMRPSKISEFVGQQHFLGEGKLLRRLLAARRLGSILFTDLLGRARLRWLIFWRLKLEDDFNS